jgi:hypothetical protein
MKVADSSVMERTASGSGRIRRERQERALKTTSAVATVPARYPAPKKAALIGGLIDHA